jgi:hypothetical protein
MAKLRDFSPTLHTSAITQVKRSYIWYLYPKERSSGYADLFKSHALFLNALARTAAEYLPGRLLIGCSSIG